MKKTTNILIVAGLLAAIVGGFLFLMWICMLLWNAIIPELAGISEITIWQMSGLFLICFVLFSDKSRLIDAL